MRIGDGDLGQLSARVLLIILVGEAFRQFLNFQPLRHIRSSRLFVRFAGWCIPAAIINTARPCKDVRHHYRIVVDRREIEGSGC